jgi:hypothetical protein
MEPNDPFNPERADHAILETIEIATEGEDCDVVVDLERERVVVTFDARKTHAPDLHDAILQSGYKPAPMAD